MMPSDSENKVLVLSFQKENPKTAFFEFEKSVIFGISQALNLFTNIMLLNYAIPPNSIILKQQPSLDGCTSEIKQLAKQFKVNYVLHGALKHEAGSDDFLRGIRIELQLFDLLKNRVSFHLDYFFTAIEETENNPLGFTAIWEGLRDFLTWIVFHIVGAIQPEEAASLYPRIQCATIAGSLSNYQKLITTCYSDMEESAAPRRKMLEELAQEDPSMLLAHLELGLLHKRMKEYSQAITSLELVFKLMKEVSPRQRAFCATEVGVCYALCQDTKKACEWWRTAIFADPSWVSAYMNLAHTMEDEGNITEAESLFKKVGEIAPNDTRVYFNLARLYSKQEHWDKAIAQYQCLIPLEADNPWIYSNLANCYLQKGDIDGAKTYLVKTLVIDPEGEAGKCAHFVLSGLQAAEV